MINKELLKDLIEAVSPSGMEENALKVIKNSYKNDVDEFIQDNQGSLTSVYNKEAPFKIMLAAHSDEISLVVNGYNNDGSLTVDKNGGIRPKLYIGTHVQILTNKGIIKGVVGTNSSLQNKDKVDASDLFVDIGCLTQEEAKNIVPLGSYIVHDSTLVDLQNEFVSARAFDDRLGVFITQEASLKAKKMGTKNCIYCTATTGEETTGRGAYASSSLLKPDVSVVVDVTFSNDYKGADVPGSVIVGKGGVICLGSIPNRKLNMLLEECAKELNLPIQYEVWPGRTGTDGDTMVKTNDGVPQVLFSIPLRYMHSPIEVASYKDIESMIDILALFLVKLDQNYNLNPFDL